MYCRRDRRLGGYVSIAAIDSRSYPRGIPQNTGSRNMNFRIGQPSDAAALAAISIEVWLGTYMQKGVSAFFAEYALDAIPKMRQR